MFLIMHASAVILCCAAVCSAALGCCMCQIVSLFLHACAGSCKKVPTTRFQHVHPLYQIGNKQWAIGNVQSTKSKPSNLHFFLCRTLDWFWVNSICGNEFTTVIWSKETQAGLPSCHISTCYCFPEKNMSNIDHSLLANCLLPIARQLCIRG